MTLLKRTDSYRPSLPSLFRQLVFRDLMDWSNFNFSPTNTTLPAVNIRETKDDFLIEVAAPGLDKKDFKVNLENNQLVISSEHKEEKKSDEENYTRREFSYQSFQRSFTVDERQVEGDKITAKYCDGILCITLPKKEEVKPKPPREIKIS